MSDGLLSLSTPKDHDSVHQGFSESSIWGSGTGTNQSYNRRSVTDDGQPAGNP